MIRSLLSDSRFILTFLLCFAVGTAVAQDASVSKEASTAESPAPQPTTTINPEVPLDVLRVLVRPLDQDELKVEADAWFKLLKNKARQIAAAKLSVKKTNSAIESKDPTQAADILQKAEASKQAADASAKEVEQEMAETAKSTLGPTADAADITDPDATEDEADEEDPPGDDADPQAEADEATSDDDATAAAETLKTELLESVATLQDERTAISDRLEIVLDSLQAKGGEVETYRQYVLAVSGVDLDASDATATWSAITGWFVAREGGQRWAWNLVKFVAILIVSWVLSKILASIVNWLLDRKIRLSQLAERLISGTIRNVFLLVGFAVALTALEIDIAPIIAAIGATGLVVGLALQQTLSNFASGLMILINRPFDVEDVVNAGGVTGKVHKMNLVSTTFRTFDNQTIYVPNNEIWNNVITNITANHTRRVDLEFGIGYGDDFEQAEQIIMDVLKNHELVLSSPEPVVITHALADSSVNIVCRPWARTADWWQVKTEVTREVKRRFDEAGISIPFPQQDVHVYQS
ncbi:Small-conductance mechanosensitive channel [Crateriforma conspicua]|nr:Small-conductance mechanosensitive channel [Crateriforma conspicua]